MCSSSKKNVCYKIQSKLFKASCTIIRLKLITLLRYRMELASYEVISNKVRSTDNGKEFKLEAR